MSGTILTVTGPDVAGPVAAMVVRTLPHQIADVRLELLDLQAVRKDLKQLLRSKRAGHAITVADARNEAGKPLFTNETTRAAGVQRLVDEDESYAESYNRLRDTDGQFERLLIKRDRLEMEWELYLLDRRELIASNLF